MELPRRTRIVATLGPATDAPGVLEQLLEAGVDVARLNLSHGSAEEQLARAARLRAAAASLGRPVALLADLPGPKLRVILPGAIELRPGEDISLGLAPGEPAQIGVTEPELLRDVRPGQRILLDDGRMQLRAGMAESGRLAARVEVGGALLPNKGLNLPDTAVAAPALTARDLAALQVAAAAGADWLALSFVRAPEAAGELRCAAADAELRVPVLAKIERPEAVRRAGEIVEAFDAVMVARGDLGIEIPLERVPQVQKRLINLGRAAAKPVVTATDMLDSMRTNPRPTRAEVSDVATAVAEGTDALMLSGETAVGAYPVEAVRTMDRIAREAEACPPRAGRDIFVGRGRVDEDVSHAACNLARELGAQAILTPTYSGRTARSVARHRPEALIVAPASEPAVLRRMMLVWGVRPVPMPANPPAGTDRLAESVKAAFDAGAVAAGALVVALAGHPVEGGERWPTLRVVRVGAGGTSAPP